MRHALFILPFCISVACSHPATVRPPRGDEPASRPAASPTTIDKLVALTPELRARCGAMENQREACARDWACIPGGPRRSCDSDGACTEGGTLMCFACLDWIALYGRAPRDFCLLRASGRNRDACRLLFPSDPQRCERVADPLPGNADHAPGDAG